MSIGILDRDVASTPIAIVDLETTGLNAGVDRVVEISVIRIEPGAEPVLAFDTLVNPQRPMAATEIHGITDDDVADAPEFSDIAAHMMNAISDCVVAAYNVYFDMRFLDYEMSRARLRAEAPHFCLMYLRPMLGLGGRCSLECACQSHGIAHPSAHVAAHDVQASAHLMRVYMDAMRARGIRTFRDLASLKSYKFVESFARDPLRRCGSEPLPPVRVKSRSVRAARTERERAAPIEPVRPKSTLNAAMGFYWDELKTALSDLVVNDEEIENLLRKKQTLGLADEQVKALHARAFTGVISRLIDDHWLDAREQEVLRRLYTCLSRLGWAPGQ